MAGALAMLMGLAARVTLATTYNPSDSVTTPATATAGFRLTSAGDIETAGGTYADGGDWLLPKSGMALYEVKATLNSGALTTGTTGSWLALSSTRTWTVSTALGAAQAVLTIEIRRIGSSLVLATITVTLDAESSP